jgi:hypothetical protein
MIEPCGEEVSLGIGGDGVKAFFGGARNVVDTAGASPVIAAIGGTPHRKLAFFGKPVGVFVVRSLCADDGCDHDGPWHESDTRTAMAAQRERTGIGDLYRGKERVAFVIRRAKPDGRTGAVDERDLLLRDGELRLAQLSLLSPRP